MNIKIKASIIEGEKVKFFSFGFQIEELDTNSVLSILNHAMKFDKTQYHNINIESDGVNLQVLSDIIYYLKQKTDYTKKEMKKPVEAQKMIQVSIKDKNFKDFEIHKNDINEFLGLISNFFKRSDLDSKIDYIAPKTGVGNSRTYKGIMLSVNDNTITLLSPQNCQILSIIEINA